MQIIAGVASAFVLAFLAWLYNLGKSTGKVEAKLETKDAEMEAQKTAGAIVNRHVDAGDVADRLRGGTF